MYYEAIADGLQLLYNIIHKLGNIYDCAFFLVKHHRNTPFKVVNEDGEKVKVVMPSLEDIAEDDIIAREEAQAIIDQFEIDKEEWWFKLGVYYGTLLYLILYVPEDYTIEEYPEDELEIGDTTERLISTNGIKAMLNTI